MSREVYIPEGYKSALSLRETQAAIKFIKDTFQQALSFALTLDRVTAPLIVRHGSGINDDLNGVERKVGFDLLNDNAEVEVVQSLAKWKRMALYRYGYNAGEGIYTDMNAIRRDDEMDNVHSIFVDQWDWEKVISRETRTVDYLKDTVRSIVKAVAYTTRNGYMVKSSLIPTGCSIRLHHSSSKERSWNSIFIFSSRLFLAI